MDPEFRNRLLATYRVEAAEHLEAAARCLMSLDSGSAQENQAKLLQEIYREFHSLKGAARAVNESGVESVCHSCEDILSETLSGRIRFSDALRDKLLDTVSDLTRWHQAESAGAIAPANEEAASLIESLRDTAGMRRSGAGGPDTDSRRTKPPSPKPASAPAETPAGTVRTPVARLDSILYQAEEMVALREDAADRLGSLVALNDRLGQWRAEWGKAQSETGLLRFLVSEAVRFGHSPDVRRSLARIYRFLDWNREFVEDFEKELLSLVKSGISSQGAFEVGVDKLLDDTKEVLMVPFSYVLEGLAVYVNDLSRRENEQKKARLQVERGTVEIDRRILEAMKDPFMHLVRNAIDHGIESVDQRKAAGKPVEGTIRITILPVGDGTVEVRIADDGGGISVEDVREKAVKAGILQVNESAQLSSREVLELLFLPQFSTRSTVSEISGRGIGLSIVKETVEQLGGSVTIELPDDGGAAFQIILPLSLARFRAIEVLCGNVFFLLPTVRVRRVGRVRREAIRPVNGRDTIEFRSRTLPLHRLSELLGTETDPVETEFAKFVTIGETRAEFALEVDEVGEERETVMKNLGSQLRRVRYIAGVSIGGSGRLVPVINVAELRRSVAGGVVTTETRTRRPAAHESGRPPRVLLVEDSITARSLLKNILEGAGFGVITARDGVEAIATARVRDFDLLLTDVEMPGMDGIELTRQIRGEEKTSDKPIVILTALASAHDKERGMEAGANAYVVKSNFNQTSLLTTIGDLLSND